MSASDNNKVHIQRPDVGDEDYEDFHIGTLQETRSETGELVEMNIEMFEGVLDDLIGDNLMYFIRAQPDLYRYSHFEQYPDCDEIYIDPDDGPDSNSRTELREVLEEAETTIKLVRAGRPIQRIDPNRVTGPKIDNLTKITRTVPFGRLRDHR